MPGLTRSSPESRKRSQSSDSLEDMAFDWEGILGVHGASLAEAYDATASAEVYDEPMAELEDYGPMPNLVVDEDDA